jgi:hypothetical protein
MTVCLMSCYALVHLDGLDALSSESSRWTSWLDARITVAKRFGVYVCVYELVTCGIANSSFDTVALTE